MSELLVEAGHEPHVVPLITIAPAEDQFALEHAMRMLTDGKFDWLVVTSQATVRYLPRVPVTTNVAAVGNVTAAALREQGIPVAFVPSQQSAAGLVDEWPIPGGMVCWPHSADAKPTIRDGLTERGMTVRDVVAYRAVPLSDSLQLGNDDVDPSAPAAAHDDEQLTDMEPLDTPVDAVLITSGSVAKEVAKLALPEHTIFIAIGDQTALDCERTGLKVTEIAKTPTPQGLVDALQRTIHAGATSA
ncbi:uroporphyrinogen-III synthase [Humidisolicoccus flavus]|uniref:uroporphyrinogen-III synthase n=1 Tax=Humidisolicoccus flavus TaxID=3111414 RepID=UPI0032460266